MAMPTNTLIRIGNALIIPKENTDHFIGQIHFPEEFRVFEVCGEGYHSMGGKAVGCIGQLWLANHERYFSGMIEK